MRHYVWLLFGFSVLVSCDVAYEDKRRLLITGTVVDELQLPVSNVPVTVFVPISVGLKGGMGQEILAEGKTDINGYFEFVSLSPKDTQTISTEINQRFQVGFRENHAIFSIVGMEVLELDGAIREGSLALEGIVDSRFLIKRVNNVTDTVFYRLKVNPVEKFQYLNPSLVPEAFPDFFFPTDTLFPSQNESSLGIGPLLANDTIHLEYRLRGNPDAEINVRKLVYDPETGSYVYEL